MIEVASYRDQVQRLKPLVLPELIKVVGDEFLAEYFFNGAQWLGQFEFEASRHPQLPDTALLTQKAIKLAGPQQFWTVCGPCIPAVRSHIWTIVLNECSTDQLLLTTIKRAKSQFCEFRNSGQSSPLRWLIGISDKVSGDPRDWRLVNLHAPELLRAIRSDVEQVALTLNRDEINQNLPDILCHAVRLRAVAEFLPKNDIRKLREHMVGVGASEALNNWIHRENIASKFSEIDESLLRLVNRIVKRESDSKAILANAFEDAEKSLWQFDQGSNFHSWAAEISKNLALSLNAPPQTGGKAVISLNDGLEHRPAPEPPDPVLDEEYESTFNLCLKSMPDIERTYLIHTLSGMNLDQIAMAMDKTRNVIETLGERAESRLRRYMADAGHFIHPVADAKAQGGHPPPGALDVTCFEDLVTANRLIFDRSGPFGELAKILDWDFNIRQLPNAEKAVFWVNEATAVAMRSRICLVGHAAMPDFIPKPQAIFWDEAVERLLPPGRNQTLFYRYRLVAAICKRATLKKYVRGINAKTIGRLKRTILLEIDVNERYRRAQSRRNTEN